MLHNYQSVSQKDISLATWFVWLALRWHCGCDRLHLDGLLFVIFGYIPYKVVQVTNMNLSQLYSHMVGLAKVCPNYIQLLEIHWMVQSRLKR